MRYRRGTGRYQQSFLSIDDQIRKNNIIRLIDEVCEGYLSSLGDTIFEKGHKDTGRKAYHPSDLLKILVYGYFNGLSSSRKLERECGRNLEMQWLTGNLAPDHKTISDFRRDNHLIVSGFFDYLITVFKEKGLVKGKHIAIDGTKVKAYAGQTVDISHISEKLEGIEQQTQKYLEEMEQLDKAADEVEELTKRKADLEQQIEELNSKKKTLETSKQLLNEHQQEKLSPTDVEARMMRGRHGKYWAYNIQTAVDIENHLITKIETTNNQNDKGLLKPMVKATQQVTGCKPEQLYADAGYYKISELEELEKEGVTCYVSVNLAGYQPKDKKHGISFQYQPNSDEYQCSEGRKLKFWRTKTIKQKVTRVYEGVACKGCHKKEVCTRRDQRMIHRNENQEWIDQYHAKMESEEGKNSQKTRKSTVEHPFGTMKYHMGQIPILLRGKKSVQTEMNLYAIAYNLKRYQQLLNNSKSQTKTEVHLAA